MSDIADYTEEVQRNAYNIITSNHVQAQFDLHDSLVH